MQAASSRKKGLRRTSCCRQATCRATSTAGKVWWSSHGALERDRAAHAAPPGSSTDGDSGRLAPQEGIARDFLASLGEMPGDVDGRECRPPRPARRDRAGLVVVAEEMPGDGDGRKYQPPRPTQSLRRDFVVAEEMPGDGDGRKYQPPRPTQSLRGDFLSSPGDMPGDVDDRECRPPCPARRDRAGLLVVAWRDAGRR